MRFISNIAVVSGVAGFVVFLLAVAMVPTVLMIVAILWLLGVV